MQSVHLSDNAGLALAFVRHGQTPPNLAGLRCGGDLDPTLTEQGREQALASARHIAACRWRIGLIVTSGLKRTDETARIISQGLGGIAVITDPAFAERRLGQWNLQPIAETQPLLAAGVTPPGGESNDDFTARIGESVHRLLPHLPRGVLLVGSKGVARVLGELTGRTGSSSLGNGQALQFDMTRLMRPELAGMTA